MWFYRQAQQVPQPLQRETEQRNEVMRESREPQAHSGNHERHEHRIRQHGREVHAVEDGMRQVERKLEDIVEHAGPVTDWFVEVVRPLERKLESVAEEKIEHLMDKNGWWKEDNML